MKNKERHGAHGEVPSILKWTGSKRSQATRIAAFVPTHNRYYEPFLGSAALLYVIGKSGSVGADIYAPLIDFWKLVRDNPDYLVFDYRNQWKDLQNNFPDYFYIVRNRFNEEYRPEDLNFLMRTCVNGIVRFSKSGKFNNSFHLSRKGMLPERFEKIVTDWCEKIKYVDFRTGDYKETTYDAENGDFVYLDPPYAGNKQRYIGDLDIDRFYGYLENLSTRGVKWALSFDGLRGEKSYGHNLPKGIYRRKELLHSGYSAVSKVLNGPIEVVTESLYLNF